MTIDTSGSTIPVWADARVQNLQNPPLTADISADACVIGAGIAGLSTAYLLAREGKSVVVLDDGQIGGGETGRTTAHLSNALDDRYYELERLHGRERARLAAGSHAAAIDAIETIVQTENIECDFERLDGFLFVPPGTDREQLEEERQAAQRAGLPVEWVKTAQGPEVRAHAVVVATNAPVAETYGLYTVNAPYRTYAIAIRVPRGSVTRALYWDTPDPYHYVRLKNGEANSDADLLIVGGEDHKTGQA